MKYKLYLIGIAISILFYKFQSFSIDSEIDKCPFCYGIDFCTDMKAISFHNLSLLEYGSNIISSKNVYFAYLNDEKIVMKKLANAYELHSLDEKVKSLKQEDLESKLINDVVLNVNSNVKICTASAANIFIERAKETYSNNSSVLWTVYQINAEPIILKILSSFNWRYIPDFFGACGRVIAEEYCGRTLNSFESYPWLFRVNISLQLLKAAYSLTHNESPLQIYLTDISPDNIAITGYGHVKFIDLENAIIAAKNISGIAHRSEIVECDNCYAFSQDSICNSSVSDHNIFAVCFLLLQKHPPWPMMTNGLLHSTPGKYARLENLVEECVNPPESQSRFEIAEILMEKFEHILTHQSETISN